MTEFTVDIDALKDALAWAGRALSPRPKHPVLAGVKMVADQGTLTVSAFDYDTATETTIEAEVTTPGVVLVHGARLTEIVKSAPKRKPLTFEADGRVRITAGRSEWTLTGMPLDEYPDLPPSPPEAGTIEGKALGEVLGSVAVSVSVDPNPSPQVAVLSGIRLELGESFEALATDRYKLSHGAAVYQPTVEGGTVEATVKASALMPVVKALAGAGTVRLGADENHVSLSVPGRRAVLSLTDGPYPRIRQLFPDVTPMSLTVDTLELRDAVARVQVAAGVKGAITMEIAGGEMVLSSGLEETAREVIDCETEGMGDGLQVAFNPAYLTGPLGVVTTARVRFGWVAAHKPVLITPVSETGEGTRHLVMPTRLNGGAE